MTFSKTSSMFVKNTVKHGVMCFCFSLILRGKRAIFQGKQRLLICIFFLFLFC